MTKRLDQMNINAVNSSAPSLCEICGSIEHISLNCQVRSPFSQDPNEVNYIQNFNPRSTNDPYSNTYNPGWKNHPNLSYKSNPNTMNIPLWILEYPLAFRDPDWCILASLMQRFAKWNQECIRVGWREMESKIIRTRIEHKWASKVNLNTHLGSHTLRQIFLV